MRKNVSMRRLSAGVLLTMVAMTAQAQGQLKALQFTSTQKEAWTVKRAEVKTTVIGKPQAVFSTSDVMSTFQAWGTCFNELDWYALQRLTPEAQQEYYERMFSPSGDLRFALGRIPVGASDYAGPENFYDPSVFHQRNEPINLAESWYSCDEMPVGETDFNMEHFTIERDKRHIIPFIKKAQEQNPDMTFWCSPWSPPQWMKKSHHYSNRAGYGNGLETTYPSYTSTQFIMEPDYLRAHALYFSKFITAYGEEGIPITGLCYQNEAYTCNYYPNTSWEATSTAIFNADYLIPYMREHHPGVKVWLGTMNTNHVDDVYEVILNYRSKHENPDFNGKKLSELFDGIGFQWEGRDAIGTMRQRYPDLEFIQTESECGNGTFDWGAGAHTFELIHHYLNNGCVTYTNWNSILGGNGRGPFMNWWQNGLLHLDINKGVAYYTPEFYAYKHYSHFIGNGTKILKKSSGQPLVLAAQQPDGTIVVVVGNESGSERTLTFSVDDKYMSVCVPAKSYNTFVIGEAETIDEMAENEGLVETSEEVTNCTSLIQNPTFASTSGWTKENVGSVDASAMNVLEQRAYNSFSTNFTSMDVHQDLMNLPAGTYWLTCRSVCGEGLITDQHAYIIGYDDDVETSENVAVSPVKTNDAWDALSWELQTTGRITIEEGQNLRIGYCSTSNGGQSGWFAVTDFQLYRLGEDVEGEAAEAAALAQRLAEAKAQYDVVKAEAQALVDDVDNRYEESAKTSLNSVILAQATIIETLQDPIAFADLITELREAMEMVKATGTFSEFEGNAPVAGETYYLYNIGQHRFVNIGYGSYGTQMGLDDVGLEFTLEANGSNFVLKTATIGSNTYYGWLDVNPLSTVSLPSGVDAKYYLNSTSSKESLRFTLVNLPGVDNVYSIQFPGNGNKYLSYDPTYPTIVWLQSDGTPNNAKWQLVKKSDRLAALKTYNGGNASFMIVNPDFYHDYNAGWTGYTYNNNWDGDGSHIEGSDWRGAFHKLDRQFNIYQSIEGLPAGNYTLSVNGYYKPQSNSDYTTVNAYLYADNQEEPLQHAHNAAVTSRLFPGDTSMERAYTIDDVTYYQPEWYKTDAVLRYFDEGYYRNAITFDYYGKSPMVVGAKDEVGGIQTWVDLTGFRLIYNGGLTLSLSDVSENGYEPDVEYKTVTLTRNFKQGWNSLSLPFSTTPAAVGGEGSYVAQIQSATTASDGTVILHFAPSDIIEPNQPYFLFAAENTYTPSFEDVTVVAEQSQTFVAPESTDWSMVSNFTPAKSLWNEYFLQDGTIWLGAEDAKTNGLRAYIHYGGEGEVKSVRAEWEEEPTGIEAISTKKQVQSTIYDLTGRQVSQPTQGFYIQNNRKILIK